MFVCFLFILYKHITFKKINSILTHLYILISTVMIIKNENHIFIHFNEFLHSPVIHITNQ